MACLGQKGVGREWELEWGNRLVGRMGGQKVALCPSSSLEGLLHPFIQTLDSKSQAAVQKLKGEDG